MNINQNRSLVVKFNGHEVCNDAEVSEALGSFQLPRISCEPRDGQLIASRKAESLFRTDGVAKPARGLVDVMRAMAQRQALQISFVGTALSDMTVSRDVTDIQNPSIINLVQHNETGLIRYGAGLSVKSIALDISRAFRKDTIYFLTSRYSMVRSVAKHLRANEQPCKTLGRARQYLPVPEGNRNPPRAVVVSTFGGIDPYHFPKAGAAVLLDAMEVTHQAARTILADHDELRVRLFGLLCADRQPSPLQYCQMVGAFGLREVSVSGGGRQPRATSLAMIQYQRRDTAITKKPKPTINQLYAANHERNTVIRAIAKGLFAESALDSRFYRELIQWRDETTFTRESRVAVVAANLPHALKLAKLLKQWPVACASQLTPGVLDRMPESDRALLDQRRDPGRTPLGRQLICTACGAASVTDFIPDFVIWAGGGGGAPTLPAAWMECSQSEPTSLLVVDLDDGFHKVATAMSRQRESAWRDNGVYRVGTNPLGERFKRFAALQKQLDDQETV